MHEKHTDTSLRMSNHQGAARDVQNLDLVRRDLAAERPDGRQQANYHNIVGRTVGEDLYTIEGLNLTVPIKFQSHHEFIVRTKIVECANVHDRYVEVVIF